MKTAISHKCGSITFSGGIASRRNCENLIIKIHDIIMESDTQILKFMFHADDVSSIKMYKRSLRKVE